MEEQRANDVIGKDEIIKRHSVLASEAKSFTDVFLIDGEIQLETQKSNPIGSNAMLRIGPRDQYLVLDRFATKMVYLFDSLGLFVRTVGTKGKGPGEYETPVALGFDRSGNIYVHDMTRLVVTRYDERGVFLLQFKVNRSFNDLRIDSEGNLFLYSSVGSGKEVATVHKFDSVGNLISRFANLPESFSDEGGSWGGGIAIDSMDRIYHITPYEYRVQVFSNHGEYVRSFGKPPAYFRPLSKPTENPQASMQNLGSFHSSWTHIWSFFLFENSIVMIFTGDNFRGTRQFHLDLYDAAGNALQTSLDCGEEMALGSIVRGSFLYTLVESEPDANGIVRNPKVIRYRMK